MVADLATVLMSAPEQAFASIRDDAGEVLAIGRLSIADGWAGITAVGVTQARRGAGLGNIPARTLYERCGFRYSHRYHYRVAR
jgi:N-acetylglutamate synthase